MKNVGHMNGGDGETSYATNSGFQRVAVLSALPVIDEALKEMFAAANGFHMKTLKMVDLGCSSGPNTLFIISHIIDAIEGLYNTKSVVDLPEFEVYFNDLPENDFNNLFKLLPNLKKRKCFLYGLPGSFYDSLIPKETLHFAVSAYSIHWLSQIPEGLGSNNKENICMATSSPPDVFEAYSKQYQRDFSTFLRLRGNEIVNGGRMVLAFAGRSVEDPSCKDDSKYFTLLSATLVDMVAEGHVKMDDLYSFNLPMYTPCVQEVEALIQYEGSFELDKLQTSWAHLDAQHNNSTDDDMFLDKYESGKLVANRIRAAIEPILASHFGSSIIDQLFRRYADKIAEHLPIERLSFFNIVISLSKI